MLVILTIDRMPQSKGSAYVSVLEKFIDSDLIFLQLTFYSNEDILVFLANQLINKGVVKESFRSAIVEREIAFPTGLQTEVGGVAIPHTDSIHVNQNKIAIAVLSSPVSFRMMGDPNQKVETSIVFLIALKDSHGHLEMLKELTGLFQTDGFLKQLNKAQKTEEVLQLLLKKGVN